MLQIKKFLEKVSVMDNLSKRDLVLSSTDARMLRDEIVNLLINKIEEKPKKPIDVQVSGGRW